MFNFSFNMKREIFIGVLISVVSVAVGDCPSRTPLDYRPLRPAPPTRASGQCYRSGEIICSENCKDLLLCIVDEGEWVPVIIESCRAGRYCNRIENTCTTSLSTCSPTNPPVFQLHCTTEGLYPDPYDCTVYHECAAEGVLSTVKACDSGWSYNAMTTECDHRYDEGFCWPEGVIPKCETSGQSGAVPENPNIYYVCLQTSTGLLPELFKCAHGGMYMEGMCV